MEIEEFLKWTKENNIYIEDDTIENKKISDKYYCIDSKDNKPTFRCSFLFFYNNEVFEVDFLHNGENMTLNVKNEIERLIKK